MKIRSALILISIIFIWGGCASIPSVQERQALLHSLASANGFKPKILITPRFSLYSLQNTQHCENREMRVYIEGDGFAWKTRSQLSDNPTPINPLSAILMTHDTSECKVYLARPCQYTQDSQCNAQYWSDRRFSPEVIESYNQALDQLKNHYHNNTFMLIGYSGGGAVAALSAASRNDVTMLVTIAGNLDIQKWTTHHHLSTLEGSLNPADENKRLFEIEQFHLIGNRDEIIPMDVYQSYARHFDNFARLHTLECAECTHNTGWIEMWKKTVPLLENKEK